MAQHNTATSDYHDLSAPELVHILTQASRALESSLVAQSRSTDLGLLEFLILIRAVESDGVTARDAGRMFGLSTSTMTGIVDRLQGDGLIRRHQHPVDRRVVVLKATVKGQNTAQRAGGPLIAELEQLADKFAASQRAQFGSFVQQATALVIEHAESAARAPRGRRIHRAGRAPQH